MPTDREQLKVLQILIGALIMGMLTFTGFAAFMAATGKASQPNSGLDQTLLIVIGVLSISELIAYRVMVRPTLFKQIRTKYAEAPESGRALIVSSHFTVVTIVAAAMIEGVGLLGAVTLFLSGNWVAAAVPVIAAGALALLIPSQERLDKFRREVSEPV